MVWRRRTYITTRTHFWSLLLVCLLSSTLVINTNAQTAKAWCFGNYAGINFDTSPISVFTSSNMSTSEGCASIGSASGVRLYTNGVTLWNGNHQIVIPDLNGNINSTQSALIVRHPKAQNDRTYIFTTDAMGGSHGLQYTVLENGSEKSKNNPLLANATERITIALHCNQHDFWIITHGWNNNSFYAYLLTEFGLNTTPVISQVGSSHSGNLSNGSGYLKASLNSNFIAQAIMGDGKVELFRFDNEAGTLYEPIILPSINDAYGVEFNYQEQFLYVSSASGVLYQYRIGNYDSLAINQSQKTILQSAQLIGALQIADDYKIYLSADNKYYLGAITKPHKVGAACNYDPTYIYLNGRKTEAGLPPEIPRTCYMDILFNTPCHGDTNFFDIKPCAVNIDSVLWDFGDQNSVLDTSTQLSPYYVYPNPGNFDATLYIYYCGSVDTLEQDILVLTDPYVNLGPDISICTNEMITLIGGGGPLFEWSTGDNTPLINVNQVGTYWVKTTNQCGTSYDTVVIENVHPLPTIHLPPDTSICKDDSLLLVGLDSNNTYIWQDSIVADSFWAKEIGTYVLKAVNEYNCVAIDSFLLGSILPPAIELGEDTTICTGKSIMLNAGYGYNYSWNNGAITASNEIIYEGLVSVKVDNVCGEASDSIYISIEDCDQVFFIPNAFTPDGDGRNDKFFPKGYSIDWSTIKMSIYNRWGELIYYTEDINAAWDGSSLDNDEAPMGAYAWLIIVDDIYGNTIKRKGVVTLLR